MQLSDAERTTLAEIAHRLGRKSLEEVAVSAKPDTILGWYRKLIANKFDGSKARRTHGRPRIDEEMESLVVRMAKENPSWGYDRMVGAMANLGYQLSDQTVGNIRAVCIDILEFRVRVLRSTRTVELPMDRLRLPHDRVDLFTRLAIIGK